MFFQEVHEILGRRANVGVLCANILVRSGYVNHKFISTAHNAESEKSKRRPLSEWKDEELLKTRALLDALKEPSCWEDAKERETFLTNLWPIIRKISIVLSKKGRLIDAKTRRAVETLPLLPMTFSACYDKISYIGV